MREGRQGRSLSADPGRSRGAGETPKMNQQGISKRQQIVNKRALRIARPFVISGETGHLTPYLVKYAEIV